MRSFGFQFLLIIFTSIYFCYAGLYDDNDNVFVLNGNNFDESVVGTENAWIVQFYNSWCGHCIRFAPVWRSLSHECRGWEQLIKVAAVDCAEKENNVICMDYKIQAYPTIAYLAASSSFRPDKIEENLMYSVDYYKTHMIDFIVNQTFSNLNQLKLQSLAPLQKPSEIWQRTDLHEWAVVFYEPETSYLGREIILDHYDKLGSISIGRIIQNDINATSVASYLVYKNGSQQLLYRSGNKTDHLKMISMPNIKLPIDESGMDKNANKLTDIKVTKESPNALKIERNDDNPDIDWNSNSYTKLHEMDLQSALLYSLRHEVPLQGDVDAMKLDLMVEHLQVLAQFLPVRAKLISKLKKIINKLEQQRSQDNFESLSGSVWLETINQVLEKKYYSDEEEWVSCKGSKPGLRGYPCGLWMTFHSITVNAALNGNDSDCIRALLSIKSYVQYFFGCTECSLNFMKGASKIHELVNNCNQAVIFLWRSHNKANLRLKADLSEDPRHPKTHFPNKYQCPTCCAHPNKTLDGSSYSGLHDGWDEGEVLKFLIKMYNHSSIIGLPSKMQQEVKMQQSNLHSSSMPDSVNKFSVINIFNGFDAGICMVFYCICVLFVVGLYLHFMKKRKMRYVGRYKQTV